MGEKALQKSLTVEEVARTFNVSVDFVRKAIRKGVLPVVNFGGRPLKPYRMLYTDLEALFTVAPLGSLKIENLGKSLGLKPSKKEEFRWPE